MDNRVAKVAILASGSGTNAERLMAAANRTPDVEVVLVASNRARAGALERAASLGVPTWTFGRTELEAGWHPQQLVVPTRFGDVVEDAAHVADVRGRP